MEKAILRANQATTTELVEKIIGDAYAYQRKEEILKPPSAPSQPLALFLRDDEERKAKSTARAHACEGIKHR